MPHNLIPLPFLSPLFSFSQDFYFLWAAQHLCPTLLPACSSPCFPAGCVAALPERCSVLAELLPSHLHLLPILPLPPQDIPLSPCVWLHPVRQLSPPHRVPGHLRCHLLPPVMYSTSPLLLLPAAWLCHCHPHRSFATPFHSLGASESSRLSHHPEIPVYPLPLSFTSVLPLKCQCRLEFLGLGVFYRFRGSSIAGCHRVEGSSGPSRGTPRSQPKPASDTVNPSRERAKS